MNNIQCPHCGKAFTIDEAGYADILKQVRDKAFEAQLHERLELAEREKENAVALAKAQVTGVLQKDGAAKEARILALEAQVQAASVERQLAVSQALGEAQKAGGQKDAEIQALKAQLGQNENAQRFAVQFAHLV